MEISGVWSALNATGLQAQFQAEIRSTVRYSDLLPDELDYYYYEGSLTTPGCSEVVQWFLLKQTIEIPTAYLELITTNRTQRCRRLAYFQLPRYPATERAYSVATRRRRRDWGCGRIETTTVCDCTLSTAVDVCCSPLENSGTS